jgi:hypothetical protein
MWTVKWVLFLNSAHKMLTEAYNSKIKSFETLTKTQNL